MSRESQNELETLEVGRNVGSTEEVAQPERVWGL